jgi:hypothetical protein
VFTNIERVKKLIEQTKTKKGLQVFVNLIETIYETGRKVCERFKNYMPIIFDRLLPKWNYRAIPQNSMDPLRPFNYSLCITTKSGTSR